MIPIEIKMICIAVDIIGIMICLLLAFDFGLPTIEIKTYDKNLFNHLLFYTVILLITDALGWLLANLEGFAFANFLVTAIYYSMHLLICTYWIMYCDYIIYEDEVHAKKVRTIFMIPTIILTILAFMSYKYSILFNITADNQYYRGDYYILFIIVNYFYVIYSIYKIVKQMIKNKLNNKKNNRLYTLIVYPALPISGVILQTIYYGVNITWLLTAVSLIIVYFNFQNAQLIIDPLTKISNRYRFEGVFDKHYNNQEGEMLKFLAIIDVDRFKGINDRYGHLEGDEVLEKVAKILREKAKPKDYVARIGGDEFAIFGNCNNENEVKMLERSIQAEINKYNKNSDKDYKISISMGYTTQNIEHSKSREELVFEADTNMYQNKQSKYD